VEDMRKAEAEAKRKVDDMRKAEAEGAAKEKDEKRAEAERKAEAKAVAVAARVAEAVRKAEARRKAQAKREEEEHWATKEEPAREAKLQAEAAAEEAKKDAEWAAAEEAKYVASETQAAEESERAARQQAQKAQRAASAAKKRAEPEEAQRKVEAEKAAQAAPQAAAKEDAAAKAPKAAKEERPRFEPPTLPAARHWWDEQDTAQKEVAKPKSARKESAAQAVGDPHLVNMHGQRFDILREGNHTLIQIPRHAEPRATLLKVNGEALHMGGACADMYFHSISVKGKWAEDLAYTLSKGQSRSAGFNFFADAAHRSNSTHWTRFGNELDLKIIWGRTITGVRYLNIFVKHLAAVQASVGGLLGEDDHSTIATPPAGCGRTNSLLSIGSRMGAGVSQGDGTFDELAQVTHDFDYQ